MYTEFIVIYAGIGILAVLQIVALIMLAVLIRSAGKSQNRRMVSVVGNQENQSIVFCTKCAAKFDSGENFCPKCGTARP